MDRIYRVWIEIEECGLAADGSEGRTYSQCDLGFGSSAQFETLEDAERFAAALHKHASVILRGKGAMDILEWSPDEEDKKYAEDNGVDWARLVQDIVDWAENAPLAKRKKKSPKAFWRIWVRKEADRPRFNQPRQTKLRTDHL